MHSRKPRLNDGYYETQNRNFQNSKYSSSRYSNNYYRDRDPSPKRVTHRSVSPEGSPRDRYHQSSSYRNKDREREYKKDKYSEKRGRDRELDYKTYNKKAKTRERSSSEEEHKDADRLYDKRYAERDSQRRSMLEKERRFGDWKEMISKGSGKKYYYNERDKSSQWEKPEEWMEYDLSYSSSRGYREKERERKSRDDRYNNSSSRRSFSSKHSRGNSRARWPHDSHGVQPSTSSSVGHHKRHDDMLSHPDMDISPDSTPTSEPSYSSPTAINQHNNSSNINSSSMNNELVVISPNGHTNHPPGNSNSQLHHQMSNASSASIGSSRLLSSSNKNSTIASSSSPSTHNYVNYHSSQHHRHRSVSPNENSTANHISIGEANNMHHNSNSLRSSPTHGANNNNVGAVHSSRVDFSNSNHVIGDGPPTPEMDLNSTCDHRRIDGATGVSSLQSVIGSASQTSNRLNLLTPSLAKFFRADLIQHVTNWPSETFEKQTQKCAEDVYLLGDLDCSRISAEIQCARSIVRVAEIAATIQGQRRLFLQEQIKSLEDTQTKNSSAISY